MNELSIESIIDFCERDIRRLSDYCNVPEFIDLIEIRSEPFMILTMDVQQFKKIYHHATMGLKERIKSNGCKLYCKNVDFIPPSRDGMLYGDCAFLIAHCVKIK